ncbi:MAG TPA: tetratricopeptide repeat protein [Verrucomicrobiae bacterium]|nr:tetratricopeptide repeat protein [Verrucomicrobiae bacterium]
MRKPIQILLAFSALALCAAVFTGCSAKARMARHQQRADNYYADGDFAKAEVEYLISVRLDNSNEHAISRLADIYFQQGRLGRAFAYVRAAVDLTTNNLDMQVKLGTIYLVARKNADARAVAENILDRWPTNADAPDILAESVALRSEIPPVQQRLDKLSKQIGETAPLLLAYGVLDYAKGDLKSSETALQRALTLDPNYSAAYYTMGNLYLAQNKKKEAEAAFKKAADLAPIRSARRLSYANFKLQTGDIEEGKRLIEEITKAAPDYVPAWIRKAEVALMDKKYDDCESLLNEALTRDNDNFDAMFLLGRLYLVRSQADKAVVEFNRMAGIYDKSPEVHYQLALAHLTAGDQAKASSELNRALSLQPQYPDAMLVMGGLNISRGDPASAVNILTQLIKQQPRRGEAYMLLGNAYFVQKNLDQALQAYSTAARLLPSNPQVPFLVGVVWEQKRDYVHARSGFEKALEISPAFSQALEELVDLDIMEGKYTAAIDRVNKASDEKLGTSRQLILAKIYFARAEGTAQNESKAGSPVKLTSPAVQDDVKLAETSLLKAIDEAPTQSGAYLLLSQLYVEAGKEQAALDRLNALASKTNSYAAYMQIGVIYDAMKDYPKACDAYEKAIAANPNFGPALNNLSYDYAEKLNNLDKALPLAEKARDLAPRDPSSADTLGWIVYKKGDYARARGLLEESAAKDPNNLEIQFHVGMVRYMMGDEEPARVALQQVVASTKDSPGKEEAARRLATLTIDVKTADAKMQADLEKRVQDEPNDPIAADRLGEIYERNGALDKAAKTYEQALKLNPQNAPTMSRLANVYYRLNQTDKALNMAKDAHKAAPADAGISALLGRLVFQTGDYNWAANLLQDAAAKLPNQPEVQYDFAWSQYALGRVDAAERIMQGAASSLTGSTLDDAKTFLAMVAAAKNPAQVASAPASQILSTNANYVPALMVAGLQAEKQGKMDDAIQFYSKALARYPAFAPAARNEVIVYSKQPSGDDQKTFDVAMKARANFPNDTDLTRALGVLAYRRGDYTRAAQLLQESSQTLNNDGELYYYLGMSHYQLKRMPQSKVALQRALALNASAKYAADAKKVLAEIK